MARYVKSLGAELSSVSAKSSANNLYVGYLNSSNHPAFRHYDGTNWQAEVSIDSSAATSVGLDFLGSNIQAVYSDGTAVQTKASSSPYTAFGSANGLGNLGSVNSVTKLRSDTLFYSTLNSGTLSSGFLGSTPLGVDTDSDGLVDVEEFNLGTGITDSDSDNDGVNDGTEVIDGTNPLATDSDNDGIDDGVEKTDGTNPLSSDTDGDGISDGEEKQLGFNPLSTEFAFSSPAYVGWNSYLGMTNILEVENRLASEITVTASLLDNLGGSLFSITFPLGANQKRDIILNDLPGFIADRFGSVKLEFPNHSVSARVMHYYSDLSFAYALEGKDSSTGSTYAPFNSYIGDENWLSIINSELTTESFTVNRFDNTGTLVATSSFSVPGEGRVDIEAGHLTGGAGYNQIVPDNQDSNYVAFISRYDASYTYASSIRSSAPSSTMHAPVGVEGSESSFVEVINLCSSNAPTTVTIYNEAGQKVVENFYLVPPNANQHVQVFVSHGYVSVVTDSACLIGNIAHYQVNSVVSGISLSEMQLPTTGTLVGRYNTFLGTAVSVIISNTGTTAEELTLTVKDASGSEQMIIVGLGANGSTKLTAESLSLPSDSYGSFELTTDSSASIVAEVQSSSSLFSNNLVFK